MKVKRASSLFLVLVLAVGMIGTFAGLAHAQTAVFYVDPALYDADLLTPPRVCQNFTVDIKVANITNLWAFEFKLWYNPTLIKALEVTTGPIWNSPYIAVNDLTVSGRVWWGVTSTSGSPFTGDGLAATIKFHIEYQPTHPDPNMQTTLHLNETIAGDNDIPSNPITHTTTDGLYKISTSVPLPPVASFTESPIIPYVNETVTFTSTSYDPDGTIVSWDWDFGDSDTDSGAVVTHEFTSVGTYNVSLFVVDSQGFNDTAWELKTVIEKPMGASIDLYDGNIRQYPEGTVTPFTGVGPNVDCDSYAPGENVSLYAEVKYNDEIVQNILVGFEVRDPLGRNWLERTDRTNETGVAHVWFRIPIPCDPAEQEDLFGHWFVIAKCKLQDDIINDTKGFKVGWIVEVTDVETDPYLEWYKGESVGISVTLKNIAWVGRNVTVVVVLYDECDVPIGKDILVFEIAGAPAQLCSIVEITIFAGIYVPKWAYVGAAKVYANAYTALPSECGIPYCPEVMEPFIIKGGTRP